MTPHPKIPRGWRRVRLRNQREPEYKFWCVQLNKWLPLFLDQVPLVGLNELIIRRIKAPKPTKRTK